MKDVREGDGLERMRDVSVYCQHLVTTDVGRKIFRFRETRRGSLARHDQARLCMARNLAEQCLARQDSARN